MGIADNLFMSNILNVLPAVQWGQITPTTYQLGTDLCAHLKMLRRARSEEKDQQKNLKTFEMTQFNYCFFCCMIREIIKKIIPNVFVFIFIFDVVENRKKNCKIKTKQFGIWFLVFDFQLPADATKETRYLTIFHQGFHQF